MNKQDADKIIASYVKKLFGFAMSRLSKIDEAEELVAIWGEQTLRMKYGGKAGSLIATGAEEQAAGGTILASIMPKCISGLIISFRKPQQTPKATPACLKMVI